MNQNQEANSLTFGRGSEVSQVKSKLTTFSGFEFVSIFIYSIVMVPRANMLLGRVSLAVAGLWGQVRGIIQGSGFLDTL